MAAVLVVDDSPLQIKHLCDLLVAAGHTPRTAANGVQAVAALEKGLPDLVVTDLVMPEMDGIALVKAVRERFPNLPVLVVTEMGSEERAVEALRAGAANYLPKRNLARDLKAMIDELLCVSHSQQKRVLFLQRMAAVEYTFELENDPDLIGNLVAQVELVMQQMGLFDDSDRMRVGVGVHEAAVNAMIHGNLEVGSDLKRDNWDAYHTAVKARAKQPPYRDRRVTAVVRAARGRELCVRLTDQGPGFDPARLPDPLDPENLMNGCGRGLLLIRTFFDEVRHSPKGNEITLTKRVGASG
jgi:CheY-like chemotaxis protein